MIEQWLCMFMKEARCDDEHPYTLHSLTQLLSGIKRFSGTKIIPLLNQHILYPLRWHNMLTQEWYMPYILTCSSK